MVSLYSNIHPMSPLFWSIYHHLRAVMPYYTLLWSIQSVARAQEYICIAMCEMPSYNHHRLVISLDHLILFDQSEKLQGGGGLYSWECSVPSPGFALSKNHSLLAIWSGPTPSYPIHIQSISKPGPYLKEFNLQNQMYIYIWKPASNSFLNWLTDRYLVPQFGIECIWYVFALDPAKAALLRHEAVHNAIHIVIRESS